MHALGNPICSFLNCGHFRVVMKSKGLNHRDKTIARLQVIGGVVIVITPKLNERPPELMAIDLLNSIPQRSIAFCDPFRLTMSNACIQYYLTYLRLSLGASPTLMIVSNLFGKHLK